MDRIERSLINSATRIGEALCTSAYWHESRCNWIGRSPRESPGPGMPITPTVTALGPELYAGTAGIALFLSQLYAQTGVEMMRITARGAITQAVWRSDELPLAMSGSFYGGLVGVAYAAVRVGQCIGDVQLIEKGIELAHRAVAVPHPDHLLDVIGGNAGAIAPLLWLSKMRGCEALEARLQDITAELAAAATKRDGTWCWDNDRAIGKGVGSTPLCGFAHGASGMGLALIEMGVRYQHLDWINGGLAAFRYEDQFYDSERGNWPDLRDFALTRDTPNELKRLPYMVAWCHGAAGIGLARLRAYQLLEEHRSGLLTWIERAVSATVTHLENLPANSDASPCHGRAGLAETLICASTILNEQTYSDQIRRMWARLLRTRIVDEWPVGVASGRNNPSLMLGYAGIGYALLRAVNPQNLPSILIIEPS